MKGMDISSSGGKHYGKWWDYFTLLNLSKFNEFFPVDFINKDTSVILASSY